MKNTILTLIFSSLITANAFATGPLPKGSWLQINGTITKANGDQVAYTDLHTFTDYTYDATTGEATGKINVFYKRATDPSWIFQLRDFHFSAADFRNGDQATLTDIIQNCAARGGSSETIIVASGTFDTCKFANVFGNPDEPVSTVWVAAVPGGEVKGHWEFANGVKYDYEYVGGGWGN